MLQAAPQGMSFQHLILLTVKISKLCEPISCENILSFKSSCLIGILKAHVKACVRIAKSPSALKPIRPPVAYARQELRSFNMAAAKRTVTKKKGLSHSISKESLSYKKD